MIKNPDDLPNAPMLRWVSYIKMFDFEHKHVPAQKMKLEDGLSRRGEAPEDCMHDFDVGEEEYLEAFLNRAYGCSENVTEDATLSSAKTFYYNSLQIRLANPFDRSWSTANQVPLLYLPSEAIELSSPPSNIKRQQCAPEDFEAMNVEYHTMLRYVFDDSTRILPEFYCRTTAFARTDRYLLEDELVLLEYQNVSPVSKQSIPLRSRELNVYQIHEHGTMQNTSDEYWIELRAFFENEVYPTRCTTDSQKLQFLKRSRRFFLHNGKLWFASKKNKKSPEAFPRQVVELNSKKGYIMSVAHNLVGHRGRDAVYKHLVDRFYWPNLYLDVSWFIRSCITCRSGLKTSMPGNLLEPRSIRAGNLLQAKKAKFGQPALHHLNVMCLSCAV